MKKKRIQTREGYGPNNTFVICHLLECGFGVQRTQITMRRLTSVPLLWRRLIVCVLLFPLCRTLFLRANWSTYLTAFLSLSLSHRWILMSIHVNVLWEHGGRSRKDWKWHASSLVINHWWFEKQVRRNAQRNFFRKMNCKLNFILFAWR